MSINKDRFRALPIKERAALINTYVSGGVMDLAEMKRHYNSFSDGGRVLDGTETEQTTTSESPIKDVARDLAYKIITQKGVSDKGRASIGEIITGVTNEHPIIDDNKMMFLYGNVNGLPPASNDIGFDFSQYIQQNYPDRNIQSYQGKINPYNEYVFDEKNKGLIEELAKKGQHIYSNADDEYVQHVQLPHPDTINNPTAEFMDVGYRDDVHSYPLKFDVDSDGNIVAHAADLYDFNAREYLKEFKPFKALQAHLLTSVGNPYILRQDNIPVKFIDLNGKSDYSPRVNYNGSVYDDDLTDEERRAVNFNWILKNISDEKVADYLDSGYIEPSIVESKKANGGKINKFGPGGDTNGEEEVSFWKRLLKSGQSARDARVGAIGAQQVRDLYSEGKTEEAQELARKYAKANTTGIALASGAATSSLLGDLAVTGATTAADTLIDSDINNFGKNFLYNAAADILGHGVGKAVNKVAKTIKATKVARDPNLVTDVINTADDDALMYLGNELPESAFKPKHNPLEDIKLQSKMNDFPAKVEKEIDLYSKLQKLLKREDYEGFKNMFFEGNTKELKEFLISKGVDESVLTQPALERLQAARMYDILQNSSNPTQFALRSKPIDNPDFYRYKTFYDNQRHGVIDIHLNKIVSDISPEGPNVSMVKNVSSPHIKGASESAYNAVIKDLGSVVTGKNLLAPKFTTAVTDKYLDKILLGNFGMHGNVGNQPVYRLLKPTYDIPIKYIDEFGLDAVDDLGYFNIDFTKDPTYANGGKINKFGDGGPTEITENRAVGWTSNYKDLSEGYKQAVLKVIEGLNLDPKEAEALYDSGKLKGAIEARFRNTPSGRVRQNDSPTPERSSTLEKGMNKMLYNGKDRVLPNMKFAIPYIEDLELKVPGVGRTTTNALDSLAKYAFEAQIPLEEALGLAAQETAFGALPQYNYVEIKGDEEQKQEAREFNRALGNSSYFRNYGIIPAENFVRDFRYNIVEDPVSREVPPLLHAFEYWKDGLYNRGDPNHTEDVKRKGREVMSTKAIQEWINSSKYAQKAIDLFK